MGMVAIFGGTFDPIHFGHLQLAEYVKKEAGIDEIVFMPAKAPWQKLDFKLATPEDRLSMVELAIKDTPYFSVSTLEMSRPGNTYTIDTLRELKKNNPSKDLFFILGYDSLLKLNTWKESSEIIKISTLISVSRPGYSKPSSYKLNKIVPGLAKKVILLDGIQCDISASAIRERIEKGEDITDLVPQSVNDYIISHNLYR